MIRRGRSFLVAEQLDSGGWTETTRPTGNQSYAQHLSTTAWATLALLATAETTGLGRDHSTRNGTVTDRASTRGSTRSKTSTSKGRPTALPARSSRSVPTMQAVRSGSPGRRRV